MNYGYPQKRRTKKDKYKEKKKHPYKRGGSKRTLDIEESKNSDKKNSDKKKKNSKKNKSGSKKKK